MLSSRRVRLTVIVVAVAVASAIAGTMAFRGGRDLPGEFDRSISSPATGLTRLKFDADGTTLFAAGGDGSVVQWTMPGGSGGKILSPTGTAPVTVLGLSSDGLLLAGDLSGRLRMWEWPSLKTVEFESPAVPATCVAFREHAGKKQVILGMSEGRIVTFDGKEVTPRDSGHLSVKALVLNADHTQLISGGSEGSLIWYDLTKNQELDRQAVHSAEVSSLLLSPDGDWLISADWNGEIRVTSMQTRKLGPVFSQPDAVSAMAVHGEVVVTGSWDGHIRIWKIGDSKKMVADIDTGAPVLGLAVTNNGTAAATVSGSGEVDFWKLP